MFIMAAAGVESQAFGALRVGDLFACQHCYRAPDVVRVVGWTRHSDKPQAKRRTVFVRDVDIEVKYQLGFGGDATVGPHQFGQLADQPPQRELGTARRMTFHADTLENGEVHVCLQTGSSGLQETFHPVRAPETFSFCEY